ncbi:MAG: hypothetical protein AAGD38_22605 [Acidobacteriota bacterium]
MKVQLQPPDRRDLALLGVVAAVAVIGMSILLTPVWSDPDAVLSFNDGNLEVVLSPLFSYPDSLWRIWNDHMFFGRGEPGIGISVWSMLETVLGPYEYRRLSPILAVLLTGLAGFWTCWQLRMSRPAAVVAAVFFAFCGWTSTAPFSGLVGRSTTLMWAILALGLLERTERCARSRWERLLGYVATGGVVGLTVSETPDIGALLAMSIAAWWLLAVRPVKERLRAWRTDGLAFVVLVLVSGLTASHMLHKMASTELGAALEQQSSDAAMNASQQWDWATQWSLPVAETFSLAVPGFHGSTSRSLEAPYWGKVGQTPDWRPGGPGWQHFKLNGYFVGLTATLLLLFLGAELYRRRIDDPDVRRRALWALVFAAAALMLAWGRFFFAYRVFHTLPFMDTIRNPEKWLGPMTLFVGIGVAFAVDRLLERSAEKPSRRWLRVMDATLLLTAVTCLFAFDIALPGAADLAVDRHGLAAEASRQAVLVAVFVLFGLALGMRLVAWLPRPKRAAAVAVVLSGLMSTELLFAARHYVETSDSSYLNAPSELATALDDLEPTGRLKLVPARHPVLNNWRQTYLASRSMPLFDPISIRVMPVEEARFFSVFEQRPTELWRLTGVRWILGTPSIVSELTATSPDFVVRKTLLPAAWDPRYGDVNGLGGRNPLILRQPISLIELTTAQPTVRMLDSWEAVGDDAETDTELLTRFLDPSFAPSEARFLHLPADVEAPTAESGATWEVVEESPTRLAVTTKGAGVLLRASRYDERWRVTIDGEPTRLLRANVLFQAVTLPEGEHRVVFEFKPPQTLFALSIVMRLALVVIVVLFLARVVPRREPATVSE